MSKRWNDETLREAGFGGLCTKGCGCVIGDLRPCGEVTNCEPGHKHTDPITGDWIVSKQKTPMSGRAVQAVLRAS